MKLVLFDLDNTLLNGDTDVEWLDFLVEQDVLSQADREASLEMDRRYRAGEAGALEYVRFYLRPYPRHDMAALLAWRGEFLQTRLVPRILRREVPAASAFRDAKAAERNSFVKARRDSPRRHQTL